MEGRNVLGGGNSMCKGCEVGACSPCLRNRKASGVGLEEEPRAVRLWVIDDAKGMMRHWQGAR
jgi:hypothetical protein